MPYSKINKLLSRLDKVQPVGAMRWKACCPAHADSDPSLAIRETDDGRILVHCFAGCGAADVIHAAGLTLADLFPQGSQLDWRREFAPARQSTDNLQHERTVLEIAAADRKRGKRLSQADRVREQQAFERLRRSGVL